MSFRQQHGFTLVELLVVVVIIALLVGIGLPAVTKIAKSSSLTVATRQVANTLSLARQYAITKRTKTRFVFPTNLSTTVSNGYWFSAYAVMALTNSASPTNLSSWAYISKFDFVPEGIAIDPLAFYASRAWLANPTNLTAGATLTFIQFTPTGSADAWVNGVTQVDPRIILRHAYWDTAGSTLQTTVGNTATCTVERILGRIRVNQ